MPRWFLVLTGMLCTFWVLHGAAPFDPDAALAQPQCRTAKENVLGVSSADITVSTTAVVVMAANQSRCAATIWLTNANGVRCNTLNDFTPTASLGKPLVNNGDKWYLALEAQVGVQCIRSGAADATVKVLETLP